jgi:hypothetical protein
VGAARGGTAAAGTASEHQLTSLRAADTAVEVNIGGGQGFVAAVAHSHSLLVDAWHFLISSCLAELLATTIV